MISEFKFYSELNFNINNNEPFVVYKTPNQTKITCLTGDVIIGSIDIMNGKKGFLFMPFCTSSNGFLISSKKIIETEYKINYKHLKNSETHTKEFNSKRSNYIKMIKKVISDIKSSDIEKVVCSSFFCLRVDHGKPVEYFKKLLKTNNDAFCYLFFHPSIGIWLGATPEKLINLNKKRLTTHALAATKRNINTPWSDKEFIEQKIVEEQIINDLKVSCSEIKKGNLQTIKAGTIFHLKSLINAKSNASPTELIKILHPTAAVAGYPRASAINYINNIEKYNRSFYTGYLGLIDKKKCDIYVNIRCANIIKNKVSIFVGGGITRDSNAISEWNEILNKSQTMLRVFQSV